jgi:hypothetical protein
VCVSFSVSSSFKRTLSKFIHLSSSVAHQRVVQTCFT